jgi:membrane-bound serine protease (ClpP class)
MDSVPFALLPNLLYLLLVAGVWTSTLAVISPGTGVYELLALVTLGGTGVGLFFVPSFNPWALVPLALGLVAFIVGLWQRKWERSAVVLAGLLFSLGSVLLFEDDAGKAAVNPLLAIVMTLMTLGFYWFAISRVITAHRLQSTLDPSLVLNQIGDVRTPIDPIGTVYVGGELWSAWADEVIPTGVDIRVKDREGLVLKVERIEEDDQDMKEGDE